MPQSPFLALTVMLNYKATSALLSAVILHEWLFYNDLYVGFNFNDFRWDNAPSGARWCILSIDSYFANQKTNFDWWFFIYAKIVTSRLFSKRNKRLVLILPESALFKPRSGFLFFSCNNWAGLFCRSF